MSVIVGAPSLARFLPSGSVLVIDPNPSRLDMLRINTGLEQDLSCVEVVLSEEQGASVEWHCYSDHRLDGVLPINQWQALFPNTTELERMTFSGQRLDDLLDTWLEERNLSTESTKLFQLILSQGSPLLALAGLGLWEQYLQRVELTGPGAKQLWGENVDAWLQQRGFAPVIDQPLAWERDPMTLAQLECQALIVERNKLQNRIIELEDHISHMNREAEDIMAMLDTVTPAPASTLEEPA